MEELETKISALLSGKMDMVFQVMRNIPNARGIKLLLFQMKEEVEGEYAERMEGLREIYRFVKWFAFLMEFMMDKMNVCWR